MDSHRHGSWVVSIKDRDWFYDKSLHPHVFGQLLEFFSTDWLGVLLAVNHPLGLGDPDRQDFKPWNYLQNSVFFSYQFSVHGWVVALVIERQNCNTLDLWKRVVDLVIFDELPETGTILRWSARPSISTGKELIELSFTELPAHGESREPSTP